MLDWLFAHTPLFLMTQSFWQDEAFSWAISRLPLLRIIQTTAHDFNPPLYYVLLHFWMKIFGSSEIAIRSLSLLFFAVSIYVFSRFLEDILKIKGKKVWFYSLLFATNPFLLYYAFEGRMYSLFALLSVFSFYFFIRKNKKGYIISTVAGLYTHYFFAFVVATQLVYVFLFEKKTWKIRLQSIAIPILAAVPWMLFVAPYFFKNASQTWITTLSAHDFIDALGILYTGYEWYWHFYNIPILYMSVVLGVLVVVGLYYQKKKDKLFWLLALWTFLFYAFIAVISLQKPLFVPRYLIFVPPGFILFLIYLLEAMPKKIYMLVIITLFLVTFHFTRLEVSVKKKRNMRKIVREVGMVAGPQDEVYVKDPVQYFTVLYYLPKNNVYILKDYSQIPSYIGKTLIPKSVVYTSIPPSTKRAFIIEENNSYNLYKLY